MRAHRGAIAVVLMLAACSSKNRADPTQCTVKVDRPSGVVADGNDKTIITVIVLDSADNAEPDQSVQLEVSGKGNQLGELALSDKAGRVTVPLTSTVAEVKTITVKVVSFLDGTLTPIANQAMVTFIPGVAAKLGFDAQPGGGSAGAALPAVKVGLFDVNGNNVGTRDAGTSVSLLLAGGSAGATLGGTTTMTTTFGEASFADLTIGAAGSGYRLVAIAGSLTPATSSAFDVH